MPAVLPAAPGLSHRFALIVDGLCRAIAARMAKNPAAAVILLLAWTRLRHAAARFASLAARAGRSRAQPRCPSAPRRRTPAATPKQRLPQGFGWLSRLVPEAPCFGSQLQHLLSDPEMAALIEAAPQAGRILRPLCRMLAIRPTPPLPAPTPSPSGRPETPAQPPAARPGESPKPKVRRTRHPPSLPGLAACYLPPLPSRS